MEKLTRTSSILEITFYGYFNFFLYYVMEYSIDTINYFKSLLRGLNWIPCVLRSMKERERKREGREKERERRSRITLAFAESLILS